MVDLNNSSHFGTWSFRPSFKSTCHTWPWGT